MCSWPCWVWLVFSCWAETGVRLLALWPFPGPSLMVFLCFFFQAETLLVTVLTPLLKEKYGEDRRFTDIWNVTMTEVR